MSPTTSDVSFRHSLATANVFNTWRASELNCGTFTDDFMLENNMYYIHKTYLKLVVTTDFRHLTKKRKKKLEDF